VTSSPPSTASTAADDVRVAFHGLGDTATITRLRADMEGRMLDRDLALAASERGERARLYQYGTVVNPESAAQCQNLGGSGTGGGAGTAGGGGTSTTGGSVTPSTAGGLRCASRPGEGSRTGALLSLAVLGLAVARLRRKH
jgi:MYXO-CTERM domain-containing protein